VRTSAVISVLAIWFAAATVLVGAGLLRGTSLPPPVLVLGLAAVTLIAGLGPRAVRTWLATTDLRNLLAVHVVRFVGIAFLILVDRGTLAPAFAPIGWGDTVAAVGAVLLLVAARQPMSGTFWWALLAWNVFGLADMVLLVVTGVRLGLSDPQQFALFRELPFGLLPTFFVPLIIATHVFMLVRLLTGRNRAL
jgi:hypothetical protein